MTLAFDAGMVFYQIRVRILPSSTGGEMNHTTFSSLKQSTGSTRMTFDSRLGVQGHIWRIWFDVFGFFAKVNAPKKSI